MQYVCEVYRILLKCSAVVNEAAQSLKPFEMFSDIWAEGREPGIVRVVWCSIISNLNLCLHKVRGTVATTTTPHPALTLAKGCVSHCV